jgi:hypothetical protein
VDRSQPPGVKAIQALLARLAVAHQPDLPEGDYHGWLAGWFNDDARQLADSYAELGLTGFGDWTRAPGDAGQRIA